METSASGYAGVWAKENTREALFDAMMRKEVYSTTGPRMTVRFFGGWDFNESDLERDNLALVGYGKGVPMGRDLRLSVNDIRLDSAPSFLFTAMMDPESGNLDRIQIIKGWIDDQGETHEKVYNVAWSDPENRPLDEETGKIQDVGNTVDTSTATWTNDIGAPELKGVWKDTEFDPARDAFYYARVIEIPTPRWTNYDVVNLGAEMPPETPMETTERAYTTPIWYVAE